MHYTHISFPQIALTPRAGHKLRGYFADMFGEESDLFHNHNTKTGENIYRYPLIQYKVINKTPMLVGLNEGAKLLIARFLAITEIKIEEKTFSVSQKDMISEEVFCGVTDNLHAYRFVNPWMALNQRNFNTYMKLSPKARKAELERLLVSNILMFFKGINHFEKKKVMAIINTYKEVPINFKNKKMIGFVCDFTTNAALPNYIGLGKSVARGFGSIIKK